MAQGISGNIAFVNATRSPTAYPGSANATGTCIIDKPSGQQEGDFMIAFLTTHRDNTVSAPGGWTTISNVTTSAGMASKVFYRFDGGSEGSTYTFTDPGGNAALCGAILTYRNVDLANPINVAATTADLGTSPSATQSTPAATTTAPCWMLHYIGGMSFSVTSESSFSGGSGLTSRRAYSNRTSGTQYWNAVWDSDLRNQPGSQAGVSFTSSDSSPFGLIVRQIGLEVKRMPGRPSDTATSVRASL